jgi:anti-sigma regulatory factor (Ser/Thr protein kinase)
VPPPRLHSEAAMSSSHQRRFAASIENLGEVDAFVEEFCNAQDIARADMLRLNLVVEELFTNTASYGGSDAQVRIELGATDECIELLYEDTAMPFDPLAHPDPAMLDAPIEQRPVGGLGIQGVVQMALELRYERENDLYRLWLTLKRGG